MTPRPGPVGVVCDDRPDMRRTLRALLERCGITVTATVEDLEGLLYVVGLGAVDVAVVALPVSGSSGMGAVTALRTAAPRCQVVVLSPFEALEASARRAGARCVVGEDDLRALASALLGAIDDVAAARRSLMSGQPDAVPEETLGPIAAS